MAASDGGFISSREKRRLAMRRGYKDLVTELNSGSDRGLIVLGATLVGGELDELMEALSDAMPKDVRASFQGIVSNYYRKAVLAYALDAITYKEFQALDAVRSLRNAAAHRVIDFSDEFTISLNR